MLTVSHSTNATTPHTSTRMDECETDSPDLASESFCAPSEPMPCLSGETSSTLPAKKELTVRYFGTNQNTKVANSYAKLTRLLMRSGLIAGITPTSTRRGSSQATLDFASSSQVGDGSTE